MWPPNTVITCVFALYINKCRSVGQVHGLGRTSWERTPTEDRVALQPCSFEALQPCSPAVLQHARPARLQPCNPAILQPCSPASLPPCSLAALQPSKPTALQACSPPSLQPRRPVILQPCSLQHPFLDHDDRRTLSVALSKANNGGRRCSRSAVYNPPPSLRGQSVLNQINVKNPYKRELVVATRHRRTATAVPHNLPSKATLASKKSIV